jgi:hypothetical protein
MTSRITILLHGIAVPFFTLQSLYFTFLPLSYLGA